MNGQIKMALSGALRAGAAGAGITLCLFAGWWAGCDGVARLLSRHGQITGTLDSSVEATRLSQADAEAHLAHAAALLEDSQTPAALVAFEQAVRLRPRDYKLWLELAHARESSGDDAATLAALRQAVSLAPHYAQPRWQLGNLLLRLGETDAAFAELNRAATSDATLTPNVADLAWNTFNGDAKSVERVLQPQNDSVRLALAVVAAKRGQIEEALRLFRSARQIGDGERRNLLTELFAARHYHAAFEVWAAGRKTVTLPVDGGFEQGWPPDETSFGWAHTRAAKALRLSFDGQRPYSGRASLRIDWSGNSDPSQTLLMQLIPVQARRAYRLQWAARTQAIVAGNPPEVLVMDAESEGRVLAQTLALPLGTSDWRNYTMQFTTSPTTNAVRVIIRRQGCGGIEPCPAFGQLWLDDFVLE